MTWRNNDDWGAAVFRRPDAGAAPSSHKAEVALAEIGLPDGLMRDAVLCHKVQNPTHAAWYAKDSPTFSDTIALVRRSLWSERIYGGSREQRDMVKIPRALFDRLTETVCYA